MKLKCSYPLSSYQQKIFVSDDDELLLLKRSLRLNCTFVCADPETLCLFMDKKQASIAISGLGYKQRPPCIWRPLAIIKARMSSYPWGAFRPIAKSAAWQIRGCFRDCYPSKRRYTKYDIIFSGLFAK